MENLPPFKLTLATKSLGGVVFFEWKKSLKFSFRRLAFAT